MYRQERCWRARNRISLRWCIPSNDMVTLPAHHQVFAVPLTESACDGMLATADWRMKEQPSLRHDVAADLSRFLGANSHVWTTARRARLERILVSAGTHHLGCVFAVVARSPRDEVMDHAVRVLVAAAAEDELMSRELVHSLANASWLTVTQIPAVREVMLRALANSKGRVAGEAKVRIAFALAKGDPSPAVRDAAVQALSVMGGSDAVAILLSLLGELQGSEQNPAVRESIADGLETLRGR